MFSVYEIYWKNVKFINIEINPHGQLLLILFIKLVNL